MNHGYACSQWHNHRLTQWWYCDKGPPTRAFDVSMWPVPSTHITAGSLNNRLNFKWLRYLCVHRLNLIVEKVVLVGQLRTQKPLNRFLRSHVVATWQSYKAFSYCLIVQYLLKLKSWHIKHNVRQVYYINVFVGRRQSSIMGVSQ